MYDLTVNVTVLSTNSHTYISMVRQIWRDKWRRQDIESQCLHMNFFPRLLFLSDLYTIHPIVKHGYIPYIFYFSKYFLARKCWQSNVIQRHGTLSFFAAFLSQPDFLICKIVRVIVYKHILHSKIYKYFYSTVISALIGQINKYICISWHIIFS